MKLLSESQLKKLSYFERCRYFESVKKEKFSNVPVGTPLVYYNASGKIVIFELREDNEFDTHCYVHGKCSSVDYLPTDVEVATKSEVQAYIDYKRMCFESLEEYYIGLKERAYDD